MQSRIVPGIISGLIAGLVFGVMMQMMAAPTPAGDQVPMMVMVAQIVGSDDVVIGWLYHLFNSVAMGSLVGHLLFGLILGASLVILRRGAPLRLGQRRAPSASSRA